MEEPSNTISLYARPELLEKEEIIRILLERELKITNLKSLTKNELVDIYKSYALPLPQREKYQPKQNPKQERNMNENKHFVKRLKLEHVNSRNTSEAKKRLIDSSFKCEGATPDLKRKRTTITWP